MKIEKNKAVAVAYALTVDGKHVDSSKEGEPLEYIHGNHMMIPGFEAALEGREEGDRFEFDVAPEQGYGTFNPKLRFPIPKKAFEVEGVLREDLLVPGTVVPMYNSEGHVVQGTVAEVGEDSVVMDFNHQLAGKTLHFTVEVVSVRESDGDGARHCCHGKGKEGHCCHEGKGEHEGGCDCKEGGCDCENK